MSDNMQQSKPYKFRHGYPVTSEEVNDLFDALLYDLLTIITQNPSTTPDKIKLLIEAASDIDGHLDNLKEKEEEKVADRHTPNWRHI